MVGMMSRSIAIANRLIFWYLLTLQKSVIQTVRSANAPCRTMDGKWSLFNRVTISNAEFAMRSETWVRTHPIAIQYHSPVAALEAAENTANMVRQPDRRLWTRAWIICCKHCSTYIMP